MNLKKRHRKLFKRIKNYRNMLKELKKLIHFLINNSNSNNNKSLKFNQNYNKKITEMLIYNNNNNKKYNSKKRFIRIMI